MCEPVWGLFYFIGLFAFSHTNITMSQISLLNKIMISDSSIPHSLFFKTALVILVLCASIYQNQLMKLHTHKYNTQSVHFHWDCIYIQLTEQYSVSRSVVSDSLRPCGLQPARLLCPWNSPGKSIGVGCYSLLQGIFLTQGSNSGLLHCKQIQGSLYIAQLRTVNSTFQRFFSLDPSQVEQVAIVWSVNPFCWLKNFQR